MKRIAIIIMILGFQVAAFAQITPSVYTGFGMCTNLGGSIGIGTEMKYKFISVNAAVGSWAGKLPAHTGLQSPFGFDVGLKVYPIKGWFLGVNYGIMNEALYTEHSSEGWHFQKDCGFSFTTGCRWSFYKGLYGLVYVGVTESKDVNSPNVMGMQMFIPRFGFILGWDFLKQKE